MISIEDEIANVMATGEKLYQIKLDQLLVRREVKKRRANPNYKIDYWAITKKPSGHPHMICTKGKPPKGMTLKKMNEVIAVMEKHRIPEGTCIRCLKPCHPELFYCCDCIPVFPIPPALSVVI